MSTTTPSSDHLDTNAEDPTGTKTTRNELTRNFRGRINDVTGIIRRTVDDNDAFRLKDTRRHPPTTGPRTSGFDGTAVYDLGAETDSERLAAWQAFIPAVLDVQLLEPMSTTQVRNGKHYTAPTIRQGYARGIALAQQDARRAGIANPDDSPTDVITRDEHQDALAREFLGTYDDIERTTNEVRTDTSRNLSEYLAGGAAAYVIANGLTKRVRKNTEARLTTIATSRVVDSANEAILRHGREMGAVEVGMRIETDGGRREGDWITAEDRRVCSLCRGLAAGSPYALDDVLTGSAPRPGRDSHPGCRCRYELVS